MEQGNPMPSALQIAEALSSVLTAKLADFAAEAIVLNRDEAALCLGLVDGVIENLKNEVDAHN